MSDLKNMFCFVNELTSKLNHDVEIDKHNDKIRRKSKSKAYFIRFIAYLGRILF